MKVFVMTDLEGATGVAGEWSDFNPGGREHDSARRMLTGDVNAAVQGAYEGGADEVIVLDGHGAAFSILLETLDPRVQLVRGRRSSELEGIDESFDLMFGIGTHSMAGTCDGLLTHTLSHTGINNVWVNGQLIGEIGLWAVLAGHYGVPLGLVVGDLAAVKEAKALLKGIETVTVKEATSRFATRCLHPQVTWKMIREAAKKATVKAETFEPFKPKTPMELKVEFHDSEHASKISERNNVVRINSRTVSCTGSNVLNIYKKLLS